VNCDGASVVSAACRGSLADAAILAIDAGANCAAVDASDGTDAMWWACYKKLESVALRLVVDSCSEWQLLLARMSIVKMCLLCSHSFTVSLSLSHCGCVCVASRLHVTVDVSLSATETGACVFYLVHCVV